MRHERERETRQDGRRNSYWFISRLRDRLRGGGRKEGDKRREKNNNKKTKNEEGVKLVQISQAWVLLRESDDLMEGLCYVLPAVVSPTELFSSTCGMQRVKSECIHSAVSEQWRRLRVVVVVVVEGGRRSFAFKDERF